MRWVGHVACVGRGEVLTGFLGGNLRDGDPLEGLGIDGRIILKMDLKEIG
jgi:hypothetical protein